METGTSKILILRFLRNICDVYYWFRNFWNFKYFKI